MNGNDIKKLGYPEGVSVGLALKAAQLAKTQKRSKTTILEDLANVLADPDSYTQDELYGQVATQILVERELAAVKVPYVTEKEVQYRVWGAANIDPGAIEQLKRAVRLPVAVQGALMPDAHVGYGLPIGGVLATHNSVIPYAVGVDIA